MSDPLVADLIRLAVGVIACFSIPFVAELGICLGRYVAERREVLDNVDLLIAASRERRKSKT